MRVRADQLRFGTTRYRTSISKGVTTVVPKDRIMTVPIHIPPSPQALAEAAQQMLLWQQFKQPPDLVREQAPLGFGYFTYNLARRALRRNPVGCAENVVLARTMEPIAFDTFDGTRVIPDGAKQTVLQWELVEAVCAREAGHPNERHGLTKDEIEAQIAAVRHAIAGIAKNQRCKAVSRWPISTTSFGGAATAAPEFQTEVTMSERLPIYARGPALTRRSALQLLGALAAVPLMGAAALEPRRRLIDVHHHFIPPGYREFFISARGPGGAHLEVPPTNWNLERDIEGMARAGSTRAVLSMFVPPQLGTVASRAKLARQINEYGARLCTDRPQSFAHFAALPLPDVDTSLAEIAYSVDVLKASGFCVYTNIGDQWLGTPRLDPIFAEWNRRGSVVFVHPTTANCCHDLLPGIPDNIIEYGVDTTRAIASIVFGGYTVRFPRIRFIFSHGGGTVPFMIERFLGGTSAQLIPGVTTEGQAGPYVPRQPNGGALAALRGFHYDTAQCANPIAMRALKTLVPVAQILFGTDYFYRSVRETADSLENCRVFSRAELVDIEHRNARHLLQLG